MSLQLQPARISISDNVLSDLRDRIAKTRLPNQIVDTGWTQGTDLEFLTQLLDHWLHRYDWRPTEVRLNAYDQHNASIDGQRIHVIHARSTNPRAVPLLISHGWPGSVLEFLDVLEPLRETFHVVLPSLPGFTFSGPTNQLGWHPRRIASAFSDVMLALGYERYGVQGGDWGSAVSANIADLHPDRVVGLHLNMVTGARRIEGAAITADEQRSLDEGKRWRRSGFGYQEIQGTKPQSLGYGLQDSPAGLAGWILEKFQEWSHGDIAEAFTLDRLLDNITAYWVTETATSSLRIYWEMRQAGGAALPSRRVEVPTAIAEFPGELHQPPRSWTEAAFNVVRWSQPANGGHFAAMEAPQDFVADVTEFFSQRV